MNSRQVADTTAFKLLRPYIRSHCLVRSSSNQVATTLHRILCRRYSSSVAAPPFINSPRTLSGGPEYTMGSMISFFSQSYPPKPTFTEKNLPSLEGKVYVITGANTGLGKELARMLYAKHAKVYVAARSEEKARSAISEIKACAPKSRGSAEFLFLDLADLSTVKNSAEAFLAKETKLNVLFNNAGVMNPPLGTKTAQGYELQLGVNNIGTFMFTKLLTPTLVATAKTEPSGSVRVVWVSSSAAEGVAPKGGVPVSELDTYKPKSTFTAYAISKAGNYLHGVEYARRYKSAGIVSVPLNPGNLDSELWRTQGPLMTWALKTFVLHPRVYGAYTQLFAAFSPSVTLERSGDWVVPWGRFMKMTRKDLVSATEPEAEGGSGIGQAFWDWTEAQVKAYV